MVWGRLATRLKSATLYRVNALLLVGITALLLFGHEPHGGGQALASGNLQLVAGVAAGFVIGVVASLLGVAGGELLIPTLVLLFGVEIKLAGSLSLAVSLPTMIVGFPVTAATAVLRPWDKAAHLSSSWRSARSSGRSSAAGCSALCRARFCSRFWPLFSSFPPSKSGDMDTARLISLRAHIQHIEDGA